MQITPQRTPAPQSNGAALQQRWSNYNGYVDNPIENSSTNDAVASASDTVKDALKGVDLTQIKPRDLARLASTLYFEGQISGISAAMMIVQQVDGDTPINALQIFQNKQASLQPLKSFSFFNHATASYLEVERTTSKLSDFIRAITPSIGIDVTA